MKTTFLILCASYIVANASLGQSNARRVFADTLFAISASIPDNFASRRTDRFTLFIGLANDPSLIRFTIDNGKRFLTDLQPSTDSVKAMAHLIANLVQFIKTPESNVNYLVDSVTEHTTSSGLRFFAVYRTLVVDSYPSGSNTYQDAPFFLVAVLARGDHTFLRVEINRSDPSQKDIATTWEIVRSIDVVRKKGN